MLASRTVIRGLLLGAVLLMLPLSWACGFRLEILRLQGRMLPRDSRHSHQAGPEAGTDYQWAGHGPGCDRGRTRPRRPDRRGRRHSEQRKAATVVTSNSASRRPANGRRCLDAHRAAFGHRLAERIERNASPAWVTRAIAGELAEADPARAVRSSRPRWRSPGRPSAASTGRGRAPCSGLARLRRRVRATGCDSNQAAKARALHPDPQQLSETDAADARASLEESSLSSAWIAIHRTVPGPCVSVQWFPDGWHRRPLCQAKPGRRRAIRTPEPQSPTRSAASLWPGRDWLNRLWPQWNSAGDFDPQASGRPREALRKCGFRLPTQMGPAACWAGPPGNENVLDVYERAGP
jgi:hypothetical protein